MNTMTADHNLEEKKPVKNNRMLCIYYSGYALGMLHIIERLVISKFIGLVGLALLSYGTWLWSKPIGFVLPGLVLMCFGALQGMALRDKFAEN